MTVAEQLHPADDGLWRAYARILEEAAAADPRPTLTVIKGGEGSE